MEYKSISYQRVKNLGNYESERLELTAEVNQDDDINLAIDRLKHKVEKSLGLIEANETEEIKPPF